MKIFQCVIPSIMGHKNIKKRKGWINMNKEIDNKHWIETTKSKVDYNSNSGMELCLEGFCDKQFIGVGLSGNLRNIKDFLEENHGFFLCPICHEEEYSERNKKFQLKGLT